VVTKLREHTAVFDQFKNDSGQNHEDAVGRLTMVENELYKTQGEPTRGRPAVSPIAPTPDFMAILQDAAVGPVEDEDDLYAAGNIRPPANSYHSPDYGEVLVDIQDVPRDLVDMNETVPLVKNGQIRMSNLVLNNHTKMGNRSYEQAREYLAKEDELYDHRELLKRQLIEYEHVIIENKALEEKVRALQEAPADAVKPEPQKVNSITPDPMLTVATVSTTKYSGDPEVPWSANTQRPGISVPKTVFQEPAQNSGQLGAGELQRQNKPDQRRSNPKISAQHMYNGSKADLEEFLAVMDIKLLKSGYTEWQMASSVLEHCTPDVMMKAHDNSHFVRDDYAAVKKALRHAILPGGKADYQNIV
jgi:hypothetical protein